MKFYFLKSLKILLSSIGIFLLLIIVYIISAYTLSYIPVNSDFVECKKDAVEIYIMTNGVHTDLVLPIKNEHRDWSESVNPANTKSGSTRAKFVAFGWGDKGFYLDTPTWADLKFTTAFKAMCYLGTSAMHVTFYENIGESKSCKKILITKESYLQLISYINKSFTADAAGNYKLIKGAYGRNDSFYDANGKYSLFFTCNTWANSGLKAADLKACLWTPYDQAIFDKYEK